MPRAAAALPISLHTAAQVRALDAYAIDTLGIPGYTLMTRAGEAAVDVLRNAWPAARRILVVCGPGNNGGDGYVLARRARELEYEVSVVSVVNPSSLRGDARRAWQDYVASGGSTRAWSPECVRGVDVIVDAMLGTGLARPVGAEIAACIAGINGAGVPVLAIDIPSGLHADTGAVLGAAVEARRTISFVGLKVGFYLDRGPDYTGDIHFDGLGIPADAAERIGMVGVRLDEQVLATALPPRRRSAHKGQNGHVLVIGGNLGMAGAARMAGEAALRVGAGLVTVATRPGNVAGIVAARPELMARGVDDGAQLASLLERATVLAVGPGLGQDAWARDLLTQALASGKPAVLDADALNLLAPMFEQGGVPRHDWILTPHPGEAARLLGTSVAEIQSRRLDCAQAIARRYGGVAVLKGAGTVVAREGVLPAFCDRGNPGMATGGMGDVLTGVIAGIVAQGADLHTAACAGVLVHATAGDLAARNGERGLIATDLFVHLPACVNPSLSR
ncbi:MAG: bifunctional ADP-dependent NAD(P)H-hydrate dehydratase/NAD(P)H-hydrate epimerase [Proteobacteria bacterium]|nr:MAG: bifunctional ADP-dependent NAD(P)H-hydrate dehydratase/NAD(P)H-hydrate epimerase [Pseudomonadota bacterium]